MSGRSTASELPSGSLRHDPRSELQLVARIREGDLQAFRELYRRYEPRLTRFLSNFVRQPQMIEEVLDDTLMVVWQRADGFKGESRLSTWIFAIAYRKAMKALRRYDAPVEDLAAEARPSPDAGPEDEYGQKRLNRLIKDAMLSLSPDHRAVVDLTYFHELGYREIAEIMNCPVDTVKTRMFYARRHLKQRLAGELPDWI